MSVKVEAAQQATHKKQYLIVYNFDQLTVIEAEDIGDCITQFAEYTGNAYDLFKKALLGLSVDNSDDFIKMYNHFSNYEINRIYLIDKVIYDVKQANRKEVGTDDKLSEMESK